MPLTLHPQSLSFLSLGLVAACASAAPDRPDATPPSPKPIPAADPDIEAVAMASNAFAADLHEQLRVRDGNFAYSPASISMALAMTYAGARGETADQMRSVMHFDLEPSVLHASNGALLSSWNDPAATEYELAVVNRLFGEQTTTFEPDFVALTREAYEAPLEPVDFITGYEPARLHINDWVASQTKQRIKDLLPAGALDEDTRLVLTNAVYFKGAWKTGFDPEATVDQEFTTLGGSKVKAPMMHAFADFSHGVVDGVQVLEMPYEGGTLAMDIFLPTATDGLPAIEARITAATINGWVAGLAPASVDVALPRFKVDPPKSLALKPTLTAMGMPLPFTKAAEFEGMADLKPLYIDQVFHKAFVEVNEKGTEAAAATAVVMTNESAVMDEPTPVVFRADRAFLFAIRDLSSGGILFMGRVADPTAA